MTDNLHEAQEREDRPSKTQRKRDMHALRDLGQKLLSVPDDKLRGLSDTNIVDAVLACKKITKGNARKRQLQYIGKLMRSANVEEINDLINKMEAGTRAHVTQFHRLEQWREGLIAEDPATMNDVLATLPDIDRQHLRQLIRNAITERDQARQAPVHFRRLFQYLKEQRESHPEL